MFKFLRKYDLKLTAVLFIHFFIAFPNASKFARKGIQLLPRTRWNDYYELTLSLFSLAAEVEAINGNYERVVLYIEEIINKGRCLEDKLRAYAALIRSMGQQDNLEEATTVGIDGTWGIAWYSDFGVDASLSNPPFSYSICCVY